MSEEGKILDIARISFLNMIKEMITLGGVASAKGNMIRNALACAGKIKEIDYPDFDAFVEAIKKATNPITVIEGKAEHTGDGVFGLPACPFAPAIGNYTEVFGSLPEGYAEFTAEFNKPGPATARYRIGEGAGVSPFCAVHQPLRSAIGDKITIGGKKVTVTQLGCKSGAGKKGFADRLIEEAGVDKAVVDAVLDNHMCCYHVKVD